MRTWRKGSSRPRRGQTHPKTSNRFCVRSNIACVMPRKKILSSSIFRWSGRAAQFLWFSRLRSLLWSTWKDILSPIGFCGWAHSDVPLRPTVWTLLHSGFTSHSQQPVSSPSSMRTWFLSVRRDGISVPSDPFSHFFVDLEGTARRIWLRPRSQEPFWSSWGYVSGCHQLLNDSITRAIAFCVQQARIGVRMRRCGRMFRSHFRFQQRVAKTIFQSIGTSPR